MTDCLLPPVNELAQGGPVFFAVEGGGDMSRLIQGALAQKMEPASKGAPEGGETGSWGR
jgi:hypothetical protein